MSEMAFYVQHRAGPSGGDWLLFDQLLLHEYLWLTKSLEPNVRLGRFCYCTDNVLQVEKNQEHMPVHHRLLLVLLECGLQPRHWDEVQESTTILWKWGGAVLIALTGASSRQRGWWLLWRHVVNTLDVRVLGGNR